MNESIGEQIIKVEKDRHSQEVFFSQQFAKGNISFEEYREYMTNLDRECDSVLERIELFRIMLENNAKIY